MPDALRYKTLRQEVFECHLGPGLYEVGHDWSTVGRPRTTSPSHPESTSGQESTVCLQRASSRNSRVRPWQPSEAELRKREAEAALLAAKKAANSEDTNANSTTAIISSTIKSGKPKKRGKTLPQLSPRSAEIDEVRRLPKLGM